MLSYSVSSPTTRTTPRARWRCSSYLYRRSPAMRGGVCAVLQRRDFGLIDSTRRSGTQQHVWTWLGSPTCAAHGLFLQLERGLEAANSFQIVGMGRWNGRVGVLVVSKKVFFRGRDLASIKCARLRPRTR